MKEKAPTTCPACGGRNIRSTRADEQLSLPFSEAVRYVHVADLCDTCGTEGDFSNANEAEMLRAIEVAKASSAPQMIEYLSEAGHSMASIERALGFAPRTMLRWKAGEISAPSIALLRYLRAFPWLIEVAEERFNPIATYRILGHQLVQFASNFLEQNQMIARVSLHPQNISKVTPTGSGLILEGQVTGQTAAVFVGYAGGQI